VFTWPWAAAASCYLKVNAAPYLFVADLEGEILDGECVATVDEHGVEFKCRKAAPGAAWGGAAHMLPAASSATPPPRSCARPASRPMA